MKNPFKKKNQLKVPTFAYELYVNDDIPVIVSVRDFVYDLDTKECTFRFEVFDALNRAVEVPAHLHSELHRDIVRTLMSAIARNYDESGN